MLFQVFSFLVLNTVIAKKIHVESTTAAGKTIHSHLTFTNGYAWSDVPDTVSWQIRRRACKVKDTARRYTILLMFLMSPPLPHSASMAVELKFGSCLVGRVNVPSRPAVEEAEIVLQFHEGSTSRTLPYIAFLAVHARFDTYKQSVKDGTPSGSYKRSITNASHDRITKPTPSYSLLFVQNAYFRCPLGWPVRCAKPRSQIFISCHLQTLSLLSSSKWPCTRTVSCGFG